jgi:hypothetical protein
MLQVGVAVVLALAGASLRLLNPANRKPFVAGLATMLIVGVMERLIRVMLDTLGLETSWLYTRGGLTIRGAIAMFIVGAVVSYLATHREAILKRLAGERRIGEGDGGPASWPSRAWSASRPPAGC